MSLCEEYLGRIERLGWVTRPMLTTLTRTTDLTQDKNLDKYLNRWQREGKVHHLRLGRRSIYYLSKYGTGRQPHVWHGVVSAQIIVYLWKQFHRWDRVIHSPAEFSQEAIGIIPDFGLSVKFAEGIHLFLIEYQTRAEAGRSTVKKLASYANCLEEIKMRFHASAVWVIVVASRERLWVEQLAHTVNWSFVYFIDTKTFFSEANVAFTPVFFTSSEGQVALVDG